MALDSLGHGIENDMFKIVPVIVLETICESSSLVPDEPSMPDMASDDESGPLVMGKDEARAAAMEKWNSLAPRKMPMLSYYSGTVNEILCYTDTLRALSEIIDECSSNIGAIWVDANAEAFFLPKDSVLARLQPLGGRFLSSSIRRRMLWAHVTAFLRTRKADELRASLNNSLVLRGPALLDMQFDKLFPLSTSSHNPRFLAVLGGSVKYEKFAVLDALINQVCYDELRYSLT